MRYIGSLIPEPCLSPHCRARPLNTVEKSCTLRELLTLYPAGWAQSPTGEQSLCRRYQRSSRAQHPHRSTSFTRSHQVRDRRRNTPPLHCPATQGREGSPGTHRLSGLATSSAENRVLFAASYLAERVAVRSGAPRGPRRRVGERCLSALERGGTADARLLWTRSAYALASSLSCSGPDERVSCSFNKLGRCHQ